jgi:hypothetical protein
MEANRIYKQNTRSDDQDKLENSRSSHGGYSSANAGAGKRV